MRTPAVRRRGLTHTIHPSVDLDHVPLTPRLLQHRRLEDIVDGFAHIQLDEAPKALVVILDGEQFVAMQTDNVLDLQTRA